MAHSERDRRALDVLQYARAKTYQLRPYQQHATYAWPLIIEPRCPSLAIDQWGRLYANPDWVLAHGRDVTATGLCHENAHLLRDHFGRSQTMGVTAETAALANKCQDAEINDDLLDEWSFSKDMKPLPPQWCVLPAQLNAENYLAWEQYYQQALRNQKPPPDIGSDCGSGATGQAAEWEVGSPNETGVHGIEEADMRAIREQVARDTVNHARARGSVPGCWVEWANDLLMPKPTPWEQLLDGQVRSVVQLVAGYRSYTYRRPSRRQEACPDIILPALRSPVPKIAFVGDTSASMTRTLLALIRGLVRQICSTFGAQLLFFATDSAVHRGPQYVADGREIVLAGRGGTDMRVGIEHALREARPDALVVATDCDTPWPDRPPYVPVIVAAIGDDADIASIPTWARVVRVVAS